MGYNYNPGMTTGRTVTPRRVLSQEARDKAMTEGVQIDATNSIDNGQSAAYTKYIRGGCFLARKSDGTYVPVKRTTVATASSSSQTLVVTNATHLAVGDSVTIGTRAANAITGISGNTLTLTTAITTLVGEPVFVSGSATARGIQVDDEVDCWNADKSAYANKSAQMLIAGYVNQNALLGDVAAILSDPDSAVFLQNIQYDDYAVQGETQPTVPVLPFGMRRQVPVAADYTVTAADNGTLFVATAAVNFTLPTKAANLSFAFYQTADANMAIISAGSADDIIVTNDGGADSVTYSTTNLKRGSAAVVTCMPNAANWLFTNAGGTTMTVA